MLTERLIRDLTESGKTDFRWDDALKGFGVRITRNGVKSYVLFYRANGRKHLATLARCNQISLREARNRAADELAAITKGEPGPLQRRTAAREAPDVAGLFEHFNSEFAPKRIKMGRMTERTRREYAKQWRCYVMPAIGTCKVTGVTKRDIERMVDGLPRPTRNRILAFTGRLFTLSEALDFRPRHSNPVRNVLRAREEARDRVLSQPELAALGKALSDMETARPIPVAAILFAAYTGLRIGEVLAMKWQHLEPETGRLTIPKSKSGRLTMDLPKPAHEVLSGLPRISRNPYVFTIGRSAPITYRTARKCFMEATDAAGLTDARLHDLRRTVATTMAAGGVGVFVLRDALGHKTVAMAERYARLASQPLREARQQAAAEIPAAMSSNTSRALPQQRRE